LAASRDIELARDLGRVTAEEYRAVGLHMNLGPQIDLTTEPRWGRNAGCFGEDADLTAEMVSAYIQGAQGEELGPNSIIAMIKHWPGSGPHEEGRGRQLVYPGDNFDYHLIPWQAAFDAGAMTVMGYYSGTPFDDGLGVNYSSYIMTDVLRDRLGFDGVVCTDWGVIRRTGPLREDLVDLSIEDRYKMSMEAGVDQFGSESDPEPIIKLVRGGQVPEERIDLAASRILRWHFGLGLFEDPYVDPGAAQGIVRSEENQQRGYEAQLKSIVLLANDGTLPMPEMIDQRRARIYVEGVDPVVAGQFAEVVEDPSDADLSILRVGSVTGGYRPGAESDEVSIEFPSETMARIADVARLGTPTVVVVNLGSTLVVLPQELLDTTQATLMAFDVLDEPLLEVIFGRFNPVGRLPFELPSSMEAVRNQLEDVPYDSENPLFPYGFGLSYPEG
jgi:beta-glucosidase